MYYIINWTFFLFTFFLFLFVLQKELQKKKNDLLFELKKNEYRDFLDNKSTL